MRKATKKLPDNWYGPVLWARESWIRRPAFSFLADRKERGGKLSCHAFKKTMK